MPQKRSLRAVSADEPVSPSTVAGAASSGDRRATLVAMRDRIATTIDSEKTLARDLAALTRRLMEITREIEAIDATAQSEMEHDDGVHVAPWDASAI